jgi:hypothetical protein
MSLSGALRSLHLFQDAIQGLKAGDVSRLEPLFNYFSQR